MKEEKIELDPKQETAADHSYKEPAVVTAAAGSGKTTLLTERVARLLSNKDLDVKAETLVILTFTRNAAKSLREKLNNKLNERMAEEKDPESSDHLKEQIFGLRRAYISTIDAFCLRIIKENPMAFDLPMTFTLADTPKQVAMQLRAIDLAMQDFYDKQRDDLFSEKERRALFYTFSFDDDKGLCEAVKSAADKLSSFSDADKWLNDAENTYNDIASLEKKYLNVFIPAIELNHSRAKEILERYHGLKEDLDNEAEYMRINDPKIKDNGPFKNYIENILPVIKDYIDLDLARYKEFCANCEKYESSPSLKTLCGIFSDFKAHDALPKIDGKHGTSTKKRSFFSKTKSLSEKTSKSILKNDFDEESTLSSLPAQQLVIHSFVKLVRLYIKYYDDIKKSSGCIDFADCEFLLLNKLKDKEFRDMLSNRFSCIIVDEFQDSNDIQAEIFRLLGKGHLFYVGDIKQSIYAFRGGDPDIMTELCDGKDGFRSLPLNMNFRSRKAVIDVINAAFSGLMTRKYGGVDYELPDNQLVFGAKKYPEIPEELREKYKCEICFVNSTDSDEKDMTAPRSAAAKIRALHDDPCFTVMKKGVLVRPDYSDFAILLRNRTNIENYRTALAELGIASTSPAGKNFLEFNEIKLIINYLTIVDNPLRDEEMLKVLMSPIYRFTAEEIGLLRVGLLGIDSTALNEKQKRTFANAMKSYSLFSCAKICSQPLGAEKFKEICGDDPINAEIERSANKKLEAFLRDIKEFRYYKGGSSVYRLVCRICENTDLASYSAVHDSSTHSVANVRKFCDMAADFEARDGGNLSDFLRFIKRVRSVESNKVEEASRAVEDHNAVQIMTFHGSKGLEIPVCIMSDLDQKLSGNDYTGTALLSRESGLALTDVDIKNRVKRKTLAYRALAEDIRSRLCGEELRLLYVAMTRAREKLIMIVPAKFDKWKETKFDPESIDELFESNQPFKWVFASLMRYYNEEKECFGGLECIISGKEEEKKTKNKNSEDEETENAVNEVPDHGEKNYVIDKGESELPEGASKIARNRVQLLSEKINFVYKYDEDTRRREKYSVTELAHRDSTMPVNPTKPRFAADARISGADKGNAYHNCMLYLPLSELQAAKAADYEEIITRSIKAMTERGRITGTEAELIDTEHIAKFLSGKLGQRMFKAKAIRREQPFYAEINGRDIGEDDLGDFTLQGRIDLYFIEDDGIVVVDYKSDNKFNFAKEKENYAQQVKIYSTVLPMLTGLPVKEIYLYAFLADEAIEINDK